jgi:hypothetical protein
MEEKKLNLCIRSEFPEEIKVVVQVDPLITVGDLKKQAFKALKQAESAEYGFVVTSYGHEPLELGHRKDSEPAYIRDRSTLFCLPPSHLKPAQQFLLQEEKDLKDEEDGDQEFAGLTPENVLALIPTLKGFKKTNAQKYADTFATEIIASKAFQSASKEALLEYISRDTINVDEAELFSAVVAWAKARLGDEKKDAKAETLRAELVDVLPQIRFLSMTTEEVAAKVAPTGVLDSDQILELFTYLAIKGKDDGKGVLPGKALKPFSKKARKGRMVPTRELQSLTYQNWAQLGYCFEIHAKKRCVIAGLSVVTRNAGSHYVSLWWRLGPSAGYDNDASQWQTEAGMQSMNVTFAEQQPARLPCALKIKLEAGDVCSIYLNGNDSSAGGVVSCGTHESGGVGAETASDEFITLMAGASHGSLWSGERTYATGLIGIVHYAA